MTTSIKKAPDLDQLMRDQEAAMNAALIERHRQVHAFGLAFASRTHIVMYGPPGVAKTMFTTTWMKLISDVAEGDYFHRQLSPFTTDSDVFGTPSIKAIRDEDVIRRGGKNHLQHAKVAYLDEGFRASDSLLNSFLSIAQERIFMDDVPRACPLNTMVITSNSRGQGTDLAAFEDRFHTWMLVNPIAEPKNFQTMLRASLDAAPIVPLVTWTQIEAIQAAVRAVKVPEELLEALTVLREDLKKEGVEPSDRRYAQSLPLVQAEAFFNSRGTATIEDLRCLRNALWTDQGEISTVDKAVLSIASPLDREALDLKEGADSLSLFYDEITSMEPGSPELRKKGIELAAKMEQLDDEIRVLQDRCESQGKTSDVLEELVAQYDRIWDAADATIFKAHRRRKAS